MLLFAVLRAVEVFGEAAAKVGADLRTMSADVPWGAVVGMRNRLTHGYFDVDRDIVWKTVSEEMPLLTAKLRSLLAKD
jgi:uncharacterized protein with HEPN domain